jgi:hypothetical protein
MEDTFGREVAAGQGYTGWAEQVISVAHAGIDGEREGAHPET